LESVVGDNDTANTLVYKVNDLEDSAELYFEKVSELETFVGSENIENTLVYAVNENVEKK
jgi:hypothetical protein